MDAIDEIRILYNLHHDIWDRELIEAPFRFYYERVLHPRERQVVDLKLQGFSAAEVAKHMGIKPKTLRRYINYICYIYRNKSRGRVYKFWNT